MGKRYVHMTTMMMSTMMMSTMDEDEYDDEMMKMRMTMITTKVKYEWVFSNTHVV